MRPALLLLLRSPDSLRVLEAAGRQLRLASGTAPSQEPQCLVRAAVKQGAALCLTADLVSSLLSQQPSQQHQPEQQQRWQDVVARLWAEALAHAALPGRGS
ncbi:hypothetical protein ABPG75_002161 [Micractinium tetrahymenae]